MKLRGLVLTFVISCSATFASSVKEEFLKNKIDEVLSIKAPDGLLTVVYPTVTVEPGMTLKTGQPNVAPDFYCEVDPNEYYTIIMLDPDVPSKALPLVTQFIHLALVNIPGNGEKGKVLEPYSIPGALPATGLHRYVFLLYKQPGWVDFSKHVDVVRRASRNFWDVAEFAKKYNLGQPIAGNLFFYEILDELLVKKTPKEKKEYTFASAKSKATS